MEGPHGGWDEYWAKRSLVDSLKFQTCADCEIQYPPYIMQFDHRPDDTFLRYGVMGEKERMIGKVVYGGTWDELIGEIELCDIVCANCHVEREYFRYRRGQVDPELLDRRFLSLMEGGDHMPLWVASLAVAQKHLVTQSSPTRQVNDQDGSP